MVKSVGKKCISTSLGINISIDKATLEKLNVFKLTKLKKSGGHESVKKKYQN